MFRKNSKIGDVLDVAILIALVMLMLLLPSFAFIISIIGNILMCVIAYRSNITKSVGCIVATFAFMAVFCIIESKFTPEYLADCAISTLNLLWVGFVLGIYCKYTGEISKILSAGALANLAIVSLEIVRYRLTYSASVLDALVNEPVKSFMYSYDEIAKSSGINLSEALGASIEDIIWNVQQALSMIVPALLILSALVTAYLIFVIARKILSLYKTKLYVKRFDELQMSAGAIIALVVSYIISMFSASTLASACANIILLLAFLYIVCGFSVVEHKFKERINAPFFRIIVYITAFFVLSFLSLVLPFLNIFTILMIAGMFDGVYDFRKLRIKEEEE